MGPDVEKYSQGTYAKTPTPELDLDGILNAVAELAPFVDNGFIPSITGIKIVVDEQMNPNDCTLVVGTEYYKRLKQAMQDNEENSKTEK